MMPEGKKKTLKEYASPTVQNIIDSTARYGGLLRLYGGNYLFAAPYYYIEGKWKEDWDIFDHLISYVMSQERIEEVIKDITFDEKKILGRTVAIIRSDFPLIYTVLNPEKKKGTADGYLGVIKSYSVFNRNNLYRVKVELTKARKIDLHDKNSDLGQFIGGVYTAQWVSGLRDLEEAKWELSYKQLGTEKLTVEDLFPNMAIFVLDRDEIIRKII
jgi:hypothetical protein